MHTVEPTHRESFDEEVMPMRKDRILATLAGVAAFVVALSVVTVSKAHAIYDIFWWLKR